MRESVDYSSEFVRKLKEFEGLIKFASYRRRIPGVLDKEDLYQEGLCILDKMFRKYDFDPDSEDFRKMFKTELWHGLSNILHRHKREKRDWRRVVQKDFSEIERTSMRDLANTDELLVKAAVSPKLTPHEQVEIREEEEELERFVASLVERLDDEARVVLYEYLNPRSWDEIPDEYKFSQNLDEYGVYADRMPKHIPQHVIADVLGWPLIRVRRAVKRIKRESTALGEEFDYTKLVAVGSKKRRRRRANT